MTHVNVFVKSASDRWLGWVIAAVSVSLFLLMGMSTYREIDLSVYTSLPEAFRSLIGIGDNIDVGGLAINVMFGTWGAIALAALALAMGSSAIAGEERDGTMDILLANPKSRTYVLMSKTGALVMSVALATVALWVPVHPIAALLGVEIGGLDVEALTLHLFMNSVFFGLLALAIGAITGNKGTATGVTTAIMVLSFFGVGFLPLVEGGEEVRKILPWYYFDGSDPVTNGVAWGHVALLGGGSVLLLIAAIVGFNRRDLKGQSVGTTMLDRVRGNPLLNRVIGRLAGSARVSSIWLKTVSDYQTLVLITSTAMFLVMGVMMGPMYASIPEETLSTFDQLPEQLVALFGGGDMSTPEGWYSLETYGLMAPGAVIVVTMVMGAGALAGEESRRTMSLLLACPISRNRIVLEKVIPMLLYAVVVGFVTFAGVSIGSLIADLGMSIGNIAATSALQTFVGLVFGSLALALSAATGRTSIAIYGAIGAALFFHLFNSLGALNEGIADLGWLTPFSYYLGNDPLNNGMNWSDAAVLAALSSILISISFILFQRRDIRQRG